MFISSQYIFHNSEMSEKGEILKNLGLDVDYVTLGGVLND